MEQKRPKLLVVPGSGVSVDKVSAALSSFFSVVASRETSPGLADDLRAHPDAAYVMAGVDAIRPGSGDAVAWAVALLSAINEGVCLARDTGDVLWANELFLALDESILEQVRHVAREGAAWLAALREEAAVGSVARRFEIGGGENGRHYEVYISPVAARFPGEKQRLMDSVLAGDHIAIVVRDVTPAFRMRQRMDAIEKAGAELFTLDAELVRKMNAVERLKVLEEKVVRFTRDLLHFDHFAIRLLDRKTGKLELVIKVGLPSDYDAFELYARPKDNGISGYVAATGQSYLCVDASKDELYVPGLNAARSSLTVPLRLHDKVIGILNVESQQAAAFNDDDRQLAEIFARYVAMAVHMQENLVVERSTTNQAVSGRVEGELAEPLADICTQVNQLKQLAERDPELSEHIGKILRDVESIRSRVRDVAQGPSSLLGAELALQNRTMDPALAGRRVLVADDQPKIRQIISSVLSNRGSVVVTCEDGGAAVRQIEAVAAGQQLPFDLVVSDIRMPDRNGYEVFAVSKKVMPEVPVILMTGFGYDPHHSIVRASQEGLREVLYKPFPVEKLVDTVKQALAAVPKLTP